MLNTIDAAMILRELRSNFAARCTKNERYSLRAFAKSLGVSHTVLSLVLAGKRTPSKNLCRIVQLQLGLKLQGADGFSDIGLKPYAEIATWVHYAILGMLNFPEFEKSPSWIGKRLGVSSSTAKSALDDLERLGMIKVFIKKGKKCWLQSVPPIAVVTKKSTPVTRQFIRGLLTKADESLDTVPFEKRDLTAITFAMAPEDVEFAKERIKCFRRQLCHELESRPNRQAVYCLALQLFPLCQEEKVRYEN